MFLRSYNEVRRVLRLAPWCLFDTCRCSTSDGDLFPSTFPFPGLLPELSPGLESSEGQTWVKGGRYLRRCSSLVLHLYWAVSKMHWALKERICCRSANLTELITLIAQKATGGLFCILHSRDSPVFVAKSSYASCLLMPKLRVLMDSFVWSW